MTKFLSENTYIDNFHFINQKSEKQNAQAKVKQNAFDELQQEAAREPYDH